jgi:hypothetical protein
MAQRSGLLQSLRGRLVEGPDSWSGRQRARRWAWFLDVFPDLDQMSVIDLGGEPSTWLGSPIHPKHVDIVNIAPLDEATPDWIDVEVGDACTLPRHIAERRYDLVFSNSVLEHVGGHERRLRFAEAVHAMGPSHWVQTPYRYFPIEPHWIAPGMQFMPVRARATLARRWPLAKVKPTDAHGAVAGVLWTELVDKTQMRFYFPQSVIRTEKVLGWTKSLIAFKA